MEKQTRQLSLGTAKNRTARLRFRIKDSQFYQHTEGQPAPGTSPAEPNIGLKAPMTPRGKAPPTLDPPGPDSEDLTTTVNKSKRTKTSKTRNIRGQQNKGTQARKGPRPSSSIEWARPHLYTPTTETQTEAEAKRQGKGLGRSGQEVNPVHTLTTGTGTHNEPSQLSPRQERENRFKWTVACFMINATALIVKLGDIVKSCQEPREGTNPT